MEELITFLLAFLGRVSEFLPLVGLILLCIFLVSIILRATLTLLAFRWQISRPKAYLELTPPASTTKKAHATQELFSVLHGLDSTRSWKDRLLRRRSTLSLEIISTHTEGVRYIIGVPVEEQKNVQRMIHSYLPEAKVVLIDHYVELASKKKVSIISFNQTRHFAFPLLPQSSFEEHDPIAYVTGAMTKLEPGEIITYQLIVTPRMVNEARSIATKILSNEHTVSSLGKRSSGIMQKIAYGINSLIFAILDGFSSSSSGGGDALSRHRQEVAMKLKPARVLTMFEQELIESIHQKVSQPLFQVSVRVAVDMNDSVRQKERVKSMRNSLSSFNSPGYQALSVSKRITARLMNRLNTYLFTHRLPSLQGHLSNLFAASEVSDLYHLPFTGTTNTENLVKSLSRALPAPLSLKNNPKLDVVIGINNYHGTQTPIGLSEQERERHVYIIGGTGNGKTTLLQYAIVQDIKNGKGLAVIDPHGDMAETILDYIPEDRVKDVIYFNPDDLDYPIGMNLLELTPGLTGNDRLREKDLITESVISIFRKIFSDDDGGGHRIEYVLRNAIHTALTQENATLFTIYDLLNDPSYRKKVVAQLEDENLKNFWKNELGKAGDMQRVKMAAGITAKIGRFLFSASARQILEQPRSTIDFDDIINNGKILICNFSKGILGEDTSELFGITVLAKLQLASLRRARIKQAKRRPFYLYVDEFQNFATTSFVQMLSEARKYKLFLLMAEQSTSQQDDQKMVNIILANVGTVITFRTGNPADEQSLLPMFSPYIEVGDIANLAPFTFYARLAAVRSQEALSGTTVLLEERRSDNSDAVIEQTRKLFQPSDFSIYREKHQEQVKHGKAHKKSNGPSVKIPGK